MVPIFGPKNWPNEYPVPLVYDGSRVLNGVTVYGSPELNTQDELCA